MYVCKGSGLLCKCYIYIYSIFIIIALFSILPMPMASSALHSHWLQYYHGVNQLALCRGCSNTWPLKTKQESTNIIGLRTESAHQSDLVPTIFNQTNHHDYEINRGIIGCVTVACQNNLHTSQTIRRPTKINMLVDFDYRSKEERPQSITQLTDIISRLQVHHQ